MMFSKIMVEPSNMIILDQPTNHLDLESIEAVNNGLINYKGNIMFTSLDHQFVNSIANRIIEIFDDGTYRDEKTNYDEYIEKYLVKKD
ncbi:MAG: ABC transporter ATP-binding protein, partial [Helcococcus sp.]|nr:ABC transporter ATP-binding protein [Helcococcus sp.]